MTRAFLLCATLLAALAPTPLHAQARPVIERLEPTSGPPGSEFDVVGRRIPSGTRFMLGGQSCPIVRQSPNRWRLVVPAGAQSGTLVLETPSGVFAGPRFRVTQGAAAPTITALRPPSAPAGSMVVLEGSGFSPRATDNRVTLGGRTVVVQGATPTTLRVLVPPGVPSGPFRVSVRGGPAGESPPFGVGASTSVTSFVPAAGGIGSRVEILGSGFAPAPGQNRVYLNDRRARVLEASPTRLLVSVPRGGTTGPFTVDVRARGQATSRTAFVVQEPPVARRYAPHFGPPGTLVTLEGNHFGQNLRALRVTLGGVPARVRDLGPRRIVVEVPAGVAGGQWEVTVNGLRAVWPEPYGATAMLRVDRVDPPAAGPGAEVHIYGQGFDPDPAGDIVRLSGVTGQVVSATPDHLVVIVPRAPSGPLEVQAYGQTARLAGVFNAAAQPTIAALMPEAGTAGTTLEIRGANFGNRRGLVDVRLAGRSLAVQSVRDDRIVVVVPPGARSGRVQVTVGARGGATSPRRFEVLGDAGVAALTPASGYEGTELTLRGQGYPRGRLMVQFPGARPVQADRRGPLELRVRVPRGATTGPVQVMLPDGRVLSAGTFQVVPTPAGVGVTAIEPECAFSGCAVTLRGYGFASNPASNRVRFNGQAVRVRTASPTALVITLPDQAGNGRFQITVRRRGEALSPPFYVQPR